MRDRLVQLILECSTFTPEYAEQARLHAEYVAQHLLNSGVIVLPVKVGQTVYVPWRWDGQRGVAYVEVDEINFYDSKMNYMFLIDMASDDESFNQAFGSWKYAGLIICVFLFALFNIVKAIIIRIPKVNTRHKMNTVFPSAHSLSSLSTNQSICLPEVKE